MQGSLGFLNPCRTATEISQMFGGHQLQADREVEAQRAGSVVFPLAVVGLDLPLALSWWVTDIFENV